MGFKLIHEENWSEEDIAKGDSLDEVLEKAAEKSGRTDLLEAFDDL